MQHRPTRAEVSPAQTWNLDDLFAGASPWEAEVHALDADRTSLAAFAGRLGDNDEVERGFAG